MCLSLLIHVCMVKVLATTKSTMYSGRTVTDSIQFVVTNCGVAECSFALNATASVMDLKRSVVDSCNVSSQFDIQLLGETIVSSQTPINQTIVENTNIITAAHDLYQIWGNGFRIPITMHPIMVAVQKMNIFESLSKLFGGTSSNVHDFEWYQFILQCRDEIPKCKIQDLCDRWEYFTCNNGELTAIKLRQKLTGHIDLHFLPDTIVSMLLAQNLFTEIFGLEHLADKSLSFLDIRSNPLELDLEPFTKASHQSIRNPLTYLRVNVDQISWSLLGIRQKKHPENYRVREGLLIKVHRAAVKWFRSSILDCMTLGRSSFTKTTAGLVIHKTRYCHFPKSV